MREQMTLALAVIRNKGACIFCSNVMPQAAKAASKAVKAAAGASGNTSSTTIAGSSGVGSDALSGSQGEAESQQTQAALERKLLLVCLYVFLCH
jgi:hypothetical protein